MKSRLAKWVVILMVVGLAISWYAEVLAENWKFYAAGGEGTFWWYDAQGITYPANKVIRVWVKKVKADEILEMIKSGAQLKPSELEQMTSGRDYERSLMEIDCVKKTYNYLQRLNYNSKGVLKTGISEPAIMSIPPKSVVETLYKEVCK